MPRPASGAIVSLELITSPLVSPEHVRSVLTDEAGAFAISAATAGTYRINVRRIGSRPFQSNVFPMAPGEVRRLDVHLERANRSRTAMELGRITVLRATPCETDKSDALRIAAFWDDARTALLATEISDRDSLVQRRFVRFVRDLDPRTLAVSSEMLYDVPARATASAGFTSPSGDSLSEAGYWRRTTNTSYRFYGPDARALLSEAFVEDHCFSLLENAVAGRIGLSFEPIEQRKRTPAEIRGIVWLDSASSELRSLEFNWTSLPIRAPDDYLGGEISFARLASGPWFVQRWRLRMPSERFVAEGRGSQPVRTRRYAIREQGGYVETTNSTLGRRPGEISGTVMDGDRHLLAGARVTVLGTPREVVTDLEGRFRIGDLAPGRHHLVVEHESYDVLGVRAGDMEVLLDEGSSRELSIVGPGADEVQALLCDAPPERGRGTIRLEFIDSATTRPMRGLRVSIDDRDGNPVVRELETDEMGAMVFCHVPANQTLVLTARAGKNSARAEFRLPRAGLLARIVRWPGNRSIRL